MTVRSLLIRVKPVFRVANFALKIIGKDQLRVSTGAAGKAFWNVLYPEGILPRGSIWPFGLYICPVTGRFFCFFHNETGWNCKGTGYVAEGPGDGEGKNRRMAAGFPV